MRVYLVRHGDADAEIPEGLSDDARALTTKGRLSLRSHFEALAARCDQLTLLFTSPLVRAVQTSQILAQTLHYEGPLKVHRSLLPDMPSGPMEAILAEHPSDHIALVGHQPSIGAVAARLLRLQSFPKSVNPGTVIGLERPEDPNEPAQLLFLAVPGQPVVDKLDNL